MPLDFELEIMAGSITLFGLLILLVADFIRLITERLVSNNSLNTVFHTLNQQLLIEILHRLHNKDLRLIHNK